MSAGARGVGRILMDITRERFAQDEQWGEQSHPDGTGLHYMVQWAREYRNQTADAAEAGTLSWRHIALEEFYEALAENPNSPALRNELVQAAAVLVAWIEDIDRREAE